MVKMMSFFTDSLLFTRSIIIITLPYPRSPKIGDLARHRTPSLPRRDRRSLNHYRRPLVIRGAGRETLPPARAQHRVRKYVTPLLKRLLETCITFWVSATTTQIACHSYGFCVSPNSTIFFLQSLTDMGSQCGLCTPSFSWNCRYWLAKPHFWR